MTRVWGAGSGGCRQQTHDDSRDGWSSRLKIIEAGIDVAVEERRDRLRVCSLSRIPMDGLEGHAEPGSTQRLFLRAGAEATTGELAVDYHCGNAMHAVSPGFRCDGCVVRFLYGYFAGPAGQLLDECNRLVT